MGGSPAEVLTLYIHGHANDVLHLFMKPLGPPKEGGGGGYPEPLDPPPPDPHSPFSRQPFIMILIPSTSGEAGLRRNNHNAVQYTNKLFCL